MLVLFQTRLLVVVFTVYFTLISSFLLRFYLYILCSLYCVFLHSLLYLHLCTHLCFSVTSVLCPIIRRGLFFLFIFSYRVLIFAFFISRIASSLFSCTLTCPLSFPAPFSRFHQSFLFVIFLPSFLRPCSLPSLFFSL